MRAALDVERLRAALGPRWARIDVVDETESTNADLLAAADAPDRTVLVAEHQIAGRGRFDRAWTSPPRAGLTFSALIRPGIPLIAWSWLPLLAGVALAEAIDADVALKWPNDLLLGPDRRKAAGILVQSAQDVAVIGIGLNVSTTAAELPVETATSLALESGGDIDRAGLLIAILSRLDARVAQWVDVGGDAAACGLADAYRAQCATIGSDVRVSVADGAVLEGRAVDVDDLGRLVVEHRGRHTTVGAGDVQHVRRS